MQVIRTTVNFITFECFTRMPDQASKSHHLLVALAIMASLILLRGFLVPLGYGLLLALMVYPVCVKLERRLPRALAIGLSLALASLVLFGIAGLLIWQLQMLQIQLPKLNDLFNHFTVNLQKWIRTTFGISNAVQDNFLLDAGRNLLSNLGAILSGSFNFAANTLINLVVIPLYAALILSQRRRLVRFAASWYKPSKDINLPAILSESIRLWFRYLKGMLMVYLIVGILNGSGLYLLGVPHAFLFGMATAFMTIIPYFGILISATLPMALIWLETGNVLYPAGVVAVFAVVQYLEANLIFPYIVGKQLGVNMLATLLAMFLGATLWGLSGMVLFLPFAAMFKILSSHVPSLQPWFHLLDDKKEPKN